MIDIHSHILPAVDDGSTSMEETLAMTAIAERDGISIIAATPHANPGYHMVSRKSVLDLVAAVNRAVENEKRILRLVPGHDAHLVPELLPMLKEGRVLTLNFRRYFLLEPPEHFPENELKEVAFACMASGFHPILTHPERLTAFLRKPEMLHDLAAQGVIIQVTAASVTGYFGEVIRRYCEMMFKEGIVHIIASDAHSPRHRPPILSLAADAVSDMGIDPEPFVRSYPEAILHNRDIDVPVPAEAPRRSLFRRIFGRGGPRGGK